jgi:hypothetical protein
MPYLLCVDGRHSCHGISVCSLMLIDGVTCGDGWMHYGQMLIGIHSFTHSMAEQCGSTATHCGPPLMDG